MKVAVNPILTNSDVRHTTYLPEFSDWADMRGLISHG
jgi:hypothetical protein